ncbi:hypothetical protein AOQ84DRAFT_354789 [Glonium stellatum]|uniref:Uncharacterized protein n=1 Tax=Glonium stellatum TaxID=574774 RepID=A0A8E2JSF3_9PEZI|nr:hypothetical protein AOQ84DRAFT_354789 [Glonium stellatum]
MPRIHSPSPRHVSLTNSCPSPLLSPFPSPPALLTPPLSFLQNTNARHSRSLSRYRVYVRTSLVPQL